MPEPDSADKIADVLGADITTVMTLLGHLPAIEPINPDDPVERLCAKLRRMKPFDDQIELLDRMFDTWLEQNRRARKAAKGGE